MTESEIIEVVTRFEGVDVVVASAENGAPEAARSLLAEAHQRAAARHGRRASR